MGNFTSKDKGLKQLITTFKVNKGEQAAFVGFLKSSGIHKQSKESKEFYGDVEKQTVAQVAAKNEYGYGDVPERPFFRSTLAQNKKKIKRLIKLAAKKISMGRSDKKTELGLIAEWLVVQIKEKISSNIPPPNSDVTVQMKGSSRTLIDTGQMRDSVDWQIRKGK